MRNRDEYISLTNRIVLTKPIPYWKPEPEEVPEHLLGAFMPFLDIQLRQPALLEGIVTGSGRKKRGRGRDRIHAHASIYQ